MATSNLYVISASSGTGKTSLVNALLQKMPQLHLSISHTTRAPRAGETNGKQYFFIDHAQFNAMRANHELLEYAEVFDQYYGTSKKTLELELKRGREIVLELDWQGAKQIRQLYDNTILIFLLPPSKEELRKRIFGRNKDSLDVIEKRLQAAAEEISHCNEYDYLIVNDDFGQALKALEAIFIAQQCRVESQAKRLDKLLKELTTI